MDNQIPHTDTEKESVYHRLRRELREEGLEKVRAALLSLAERLAPESLPNLRDIEDLDALELAVEEAIRAASRG